MVLHTNETVTVARKIIGLKYHNKNTVQQLSDHEYGTKAIYMNGHFDRSKLSRGSARLSVRYQILKTKSLNKLHSKERTPVFSYRRLFSFIFYFIRHMIEIKHVLQGQLDSIFSYSI